MSILRLIIFLGLIIPLNLFSQNLSTLSGKISDGNAPIQFANVAIFNKDSLLLSGTISSEIGDFIIPKISAQEVILQVSFLGYETKNLNIKLHKLNNNTGVIILTPNLQNLDEVIVSGSKPTFSIKGASLVTNVRSSLLSSLGNGFDVIENIPGVKLQEEEITVFGKGEPIVYINSRRVLDLNELDQLSSTEISTVELLNNPGAKYDAEGRAVLIIKTKKKVFNGLSLTIQEQVKLGQYFNNTEKLSLAYTRDNISLFGSYYQTNKKTRNNDKAIYELSTDTVWYQNIDFPYKLEYKIHKFAGGFDWSLAPKHIIGMQYKGYFDDSDYNMHGNIIVAANNKAYDQIDVQSLKKENPNQHILNAFYNFTISDNFKSQLDFDYLNNHTESEQFVEEKSEIEGDRILNVVERSDFELVAGKLISNYKFIENAELEFGGEYNHINGDGYLINNEELFKSNIYTNEEVKFALFANLNMNFKNWDVSFGIRHENSNEILTEDEKANRIVDRDYNDFFPSFSISKKSENIQLSLSANKRIKRPSFSQLNGNNVYINRFLIQRGNPFLDREQIYDVNYQMIYKMLSVNIGYTYIKNPIGIGFEYEPESKYTFLTFTNYNKYQNMSCMLTAKHKINWWHPQLTLKILQPFFCIDGSSGKQEYEKTNFSIDFYNQFKLPKKYILTAYFNYQNEQHYYLQKWKELFRLNLGLRKSYFNKRLDAKIDFKDVFNWVENNATTQIDNYSLKVNNNRETQYVLISLKYKFNNYKRRYRGKNAAPADFNRM
jgi:hypothetical protein